MTPRKTLAAAALMCALVACSPQVGSPNAPSAPTTSSPAPTALPTYFTATTTHDIRVTVKPQTVVSLPPINFDGRPVEVRWSVEYINFIPDGTTLTSVFIQLCVDGVPTVQLATFGAHSTDENRHAPVDVGDIFDGPRTLSGVHTLSIVAFNWSGGMDAYLRAGPATPADINKPMRLTAKYLA